MLNSYLPERYAADKAFVVDSNGAFSQQLDLVVYEPPVFTIHFPLHEKKVIPAESVYAVFEAKQSINAGIADNVDASRPAAFRSRNLRDSRTCERPKALAMRWGSRRRQ